MNLLKTEPVAVAAAIMAILNVLVALAVISLTDVQLGTINTAVGLVLALIVRSQVTPTP